MYLKDVVEEALKASRFSNDPDTQVGAVIFSKSFIISTGFNRIPASAPVTRTGNSLDTKYPYVLHAEADAIIKAYKRQHDLQSKKMLVTLFPCNDCAKLICHAGIRELYYLDDKYADRDFTIAAKRLFDMFGVSYNKVDMGD